MSSIEPNWLSLLWFTLFAAICGISLLIVTGMFPLGHDPEGRRRSGLTVLLVLGNAALLLALAIGTGIYGYNELRWSSLVAVTGLIILFAPGLFEEWRWPIGGIRTQLAVLVGVQALALVTLSQIGGTVLPFAS
ncbi:hypothetical protein OCAR_6864 [Afipia carboxidovorans OM5]|uniref:Transmembrane protein n=1 Tax=Afipia carboxidovorans (strain ATCC 49405 / DSM 1227 / KCTC 32145 / OM5) TaxID=504832 RepID=B6JE80_AFIC5|nr:hypothetical protein [Afipia carboxidovorans]ACI93973.1 hypothetical protein OCAR_6864 [Afipia carboxidovorans OM5]AEI02357.1 hypothetical protein OCA4_c12150 [Afipia carboxidovorans OM4]AEI05933.1 hypothetical protein OCA5_c12150 [Afipia carboxidovorans OM5]BEV46718.1 hypothetical protein CRBSH125_29010 [Afipia carboxidovorans]